MLAVSFGTPAELGGANYGWYPENYSRVFDPLFAPILVRSVTYALATVALCLVLGYPVAYYIARFGGRRKQILIALVVLPALWPAVLAAGLLVFALSFDDFVLSYFTTGESPQPLPVRIWSAIRFGVTPTINAIGTLMLVISLAAVALALVLQRERRA